MPEQLSQALARSGSGFDAKLQTVLGTFQNLQRAQFAKQQMAQQLEQQKQLIDYRAQAEVEKQKQIFEHITQPQLEAQALADSQKQLRDMLSQAEKDVEGKYRDFYNRFPNVSRFRLASPDFDISFDEQTSQVRVNTYLNGQEVSPQEYESTLQRYDEFGRWVSKIESDSGNLPELTSEEERQIRQERGVSPIHAGNAAEIIREVKTNRLGAERWFQAWDNGIAMRADAFPDAQEQQDPYSPAIRNLGVEQTRLLSAYGSDGVFDLNVRAGNWYSRKTGQLNLDINNDSIFGTKQKIERFVSDLDLDVMSLRSEDGRGEIYEVLENAGLESDVITSLFDIYRATITIPDLYAEARAEEGEVHPSTRLYFNPYGQVSDVRDFVRIQPPTENSWRQGYNNLR